MNNMETANTLVYASPRQSLYNIRHDHRLILNCIEDNGGEIDEETEKALALTEEDFKDKAVSYANIIKQKAAEEATISREIDRLQQRLSQAKKLRESLSDRLKAAMIQFNTPFIKTELITISFRKSESVEITNLGELPDKYKSEYVEMKVDKAAIKKDFKEGVVPGARIVPNQNLQIR